MKVTNNNDVLLLLNIVRDNLQSSKKLFAKMLVNDNEISRNSIEYKKIDRLETLLMNFEDRLVSEIEYFSNEEKKWKV